MARSTENTREVAAAKRKTEEDKEESKEISFDDDYLALRDGSDKYKAEGEMKEPLDEVILSLICPALNPKISWKPSIR